MAQVSYSRQALEDLERAFEFLAGNDPLSGARAVTAIRGAINVLAEHPLIGRNAGSDLRELVISFGNTGYMALYWYAAERNEVIVLGIRHQRELDYPS